MSRLQKAVTVALETWDGKGDEPIWHSMEYLRQQLLREREIAKERQRKRRSRPREEEG